MRIFLILLLIIPHIGALAASPAPVRVVKETYYPTPSIPSDTIKRTFSDGSTDIIRVVGSRQTEAGLVRIVQKALDDEDEIRWPPFGSNSLLLGTNEIYGDGDALTIYGSYVIGGKTYLFIGDNCTGSGCRTSGQLAFLLLEGHRRTRTITTKDFFAESNSKSFGTKMQDESIVVDLGTSDQSEKLAILKNDRVTIEYQKLPYKPLAREECEELYDLAYDCIEMPKYFKDSSCDAHGKNYDGNMQGNAGIWNMRYLRNEPGFNRNAFDKACVNACATGKLDKPQTFGKKVCGRPIYKRPTR